MSKVSKTAYPVDCAICGHHEKRSWHFSKHVLSKHGLTAELYTIKHLRDGKEPECLECGARTRYCTFAFKDFCKEHSRLAESRGGAIGGKAPAWNKGQTVETDPRILKHTFSGEKNAFFGRHHTEEAKQSNADKHRLSREEFLRRTSVRPDTFLCLSSYDDYRYRQGQKLSFKCLVCNTIIKHTLLNFERNPICKVCHPGGSKEQLEIADFIKSLGFDVIYNDRAAIKPKELDIYVPAKKLAVEYNSFYFHAHSDENSREDRHHEKTILAHAAGIDLIHVFQDEWLDKAHIVKSMLAHRLGMTQRRIHGRECVVRTITSRTARDFFEQNHVAGYSRAGVICLGLFLDDELVSAMSFRKPFHKQKYANKVEMARFASLVNAHVVGGLQKLLKVAMKHCVSLGYDGLVTYADLRYGRGLGYEKAGFKLNGWTGLSYDYTDGAKRFSRFKFRAQPELGRSERDVASAAGVSRIYGCGSNRYVLEVPNVSFA